MRTTTQKRFKGLISALAAGLVFSCFIAVACTLMAQLGAGSAIAMTPQEVDSLSDRLRLEPKQGVYGGANGRLQRLGYREYWLATGGVSYAAGKELGLGPWAVSEIEAGWPLRSFRRSVITPIDFNVVFGNRPSVISLNSDRIVIPMRPFWGRLALNSLFYALLVWLVLFGPGIVRRIVRTRRGLCPACAYPVGTSDTCSECGHKLRIAT